MNEHMISNIIEILVIGGLLLWLIKLAYSQGQRIARLEGVFDYMRGDHDKIVGVEKKQEKFEDDLNEYYSRLRAVEEQSQH